MERFFDKRGLRSEYSRGFSRIVDVVFAHELLHHLARHFGQSSGAAHVAAGAAEQRPEIVALERFGRAAAGEAQRDDRPLLFVLRRFWLRLVRKSGVARAQG